MQPGSENPALLAPAITCSGSSVLSLKRIPFGPAWHIVAGHFVTRPHCLAIYRRLKIRETWIWVAKVIRGPPILSGKGLAVLTDCTVTLLLNLFLPARRYRTSTECLQVQICRPLRFNRVMLDVALGDWFAELVDDESHHCYFMKGAPTSHRAIGKTVLKQKNDFCGDLAGASVQSHKHRTQIAWLLRSRTSQPVISMLAKF